MKIFFTICTVLFSLTLAAQDCSCLDEYRFVKKHFETNHGGFNKKIKSPEEPAYKKFTAELEESIKKNKSDKYCIAYLKKYILYLQDHHSNIVGAGTPVREDSAAALAAFFKSPVYLGTEILSLDEKKIEQLAGSRDPIEGIYYTPDSTYIVALVKSKTADRDYAAVILSSRTKLWSAGQVKFELKQVNDSLMETFTYLRNHSLNYDQQVYKKGKPFVLNGWVRSGGPQADGAQVSTDLVRFAVLDSSTTLLSIRSFDGRLISKLDSAYKEIIPQIKKYPKLIIDIRNNGGGSDDAYKALMPLIYTTPFNSDVVEYYSTPENIAAYNRYDSSFAISNPHTEPPFKQPVLLMKSKPYSFIGFGNGKPSVKKYEINKGYPLKVAVLFNRNCASSCESFLFEIMNSKKTIMAGENSGGYTGYGNVMTIRTPCGNYLSWTTTVYKDQWKYEFIGIPPQYRIPGEETDWVGYTRRLLNMKR